MFMVSCGSDWTAGFLGIESRLIVSCKWAESGLLRSTIVCRGFCEFCWAASSAAAASAAAKIY